MGGTHEKGIGKEKGGMGRGRDGNFWGDMGVGWLLGIGLKPPRAPVSPSKLCLAPCVQTSPSVQPKEEQVSESRGDNSRVCSLATASSCSVRRSGAATGVDSSPDGSSTTEHTSSVHSPASSPRTPGKELNPREAVADFRPWLGDDSEDEEDQWDEIEARERAAEAVGDWGPDFW